MTQTKSVPTRPAKNKNRSPVPSILPRERLTKKAFAAISEYATIKAKKLGLPFHHFMVQYVLEAERMRRSDLYAWLTLRNYRWRPQFGFWARDEEKVVQVNDKTGMAEVRR